MFRKNTSGQNIGFCLVNATTGAALTGATVTVKRMIDGAAQASATGTVSEGGSGQYNFALSQADTNGNQISLLFTATNAVPVEKTIVTTAADPTTATNFGITALPATACTTNASLLTSGTGTDQLSVASGRVDIGKVVGNAQTADANGLLKVDVEDWKGNAVPAANVSGVPLVDVKYTLGTLSAGAAGYVGIDWGQVANKTTTNALTGTTISTTQAVASVSGSVGSVTGAVGSVTAAVTLSAGDSPVSQSGTAQAGGNTSITLAAGASATDSLYVGQTVKLTGGTGTGQARVITAYTGSTKVATVDRAWQTNPDNTSVYAVLATDHPKTDGNLAVTAGTVSDKTGYSLSQSFPANFASLGITAGGHVSNVDTVTGNVTVGGYASGQDPATLVLDVAASSHNTANTVGAKINSAGSAGDPLANAVPGSYAAGTAGYVLGHGPSLDGNGRVTLAPAGLDAITVEAGLNPRQALAMITAVCNGNTSGAGTNTIVFAAAGNPAVTRVSAALDTGGNRTNTLTIPA